MYYIWQCGLFEGTTSPPSGFVFTLSNPIVMLVVEVFLSRKKKNIYLLKKFTFFEKGRPSLLLRTMAGYIFDTIDVGCLLICRSGAGPMQQAGDS